MARKADVRRKISQELGSDTAKEFDELYSTIKKTYHKIELISSDQVDNYLWIEDGTAGGRWGIGFLAEDTSDLMDKMRMKLDKLREKAREHRKTFPMMYRNHPYPNNHLFESDNW